MQYINILYSFVIFNKIIPDYFLIPIFFLYLLVNINNFNLNLKALFMIFFIMLLIILDNIFNNEFFNNILFFHLLFFIIVTVVFKQKNFSQKSFIKVLKFYSILNFILLFSFFFPDLREYTFYQNLGFFRYRSLFKEPSLLAIFSSFNIMIFLFYYNNKNKIYYILMNLLQLFFSFSISGLILLFLIINIYLIYKKFSIKKFLSILTLFFLTYTYIYNVDNIFTNRIRNISIGILDNSAKLRIYAPLELLEKIIIKSKYLLIGLGDPRTFVKKNIEDFNYFYLWNGRATFQVNNGYVVIISMGGILLYFIIMSYLIITFKRQKIPLLIFILLLPFFSGHFVSIYFWFLLSLYTLNLRFSIG